MFLDQKNFFVQCLGQVLHQFKNSVGFFCCCYIFKQHIEFDLVLAKEECIGREPWQYYLQSQRPLIGSLPNFSQFRKRLHDSIFQVFKFVVGGEEAEQRLPVMIGNVKNKNIEECPGIRNKDFPVAILVSHDEDKGENLRSSALAQRVLMLTLRYQRADPKEDQRENYV
jgi:hypothetical protein